MATSNLPAWAAQWDQMASGAKAPASPALPAWAAQWDSLSKTHGVIKGGNPAMEPATLQLGPLDTHLPIPGWLNRGLAGAGEDVVNLGRGLGERVGMISPQQIAQDQKLDAPLNATSAGKVGKFLGGVGTAALAAPIPGVDTAVGGMLLGGALGAATPTTKPGEAFANTAAGALTGGLGTWAGNKLSGWATSALGRRIANAAAEKAKNVDRDALISASREAGYVIPPTAARPNALNTAVESIAGKAATRQGAEATNQGATNAVVAGDLGLPTDRPITRAALAGVRKKAGGVYKALEGIGQIQSDEQYKAALQQLLNAGPDLEKAYPGIGSQASQSVQDLVKSASVDTHQGDSAVALTKLLRNRAKGNFQSAFKSGDPEALELAHAQQGVSNALEDLIGRHLEKNGQGDLAAQWKAARATIAKSYQAQAALKGTNVSALRLATQAERQPMTGGMGLAANFAGQFPEVSRLPKSGVGVSKLGAVLGLMGEGGAAYMHSPEMALGGLGMMALPYAARGALLSPIGQRMLATPNYAPGLLGTAALKALEAGGKRASLALPILQAAPQ